MRKLLLLLIVFAVVAILEYGRDDTLYSDAPTSATVASDAVFARAFEKRISDVQVEGRGTVVKLLSDDKDGSRHQRFIVRLSSG